MNKSIQAEVLSVDTGEIRFEQDSDRPNQIQIPVKTPAGIQELGELSLDKLDEAIDRLKQKAKSLAWRG